MTLAVCSLLNWTIFSLPIVPVKSPKLSKPTSSFVSQLYKANWKNPIIAGTLCSELGDFSLTDDNPSITSSCWTQHVKICIRVCTFCYFILYRNVLTLFLIYRAVRIFRRVMCYWTNSSFYLVQRIPGCRC